MNGICYIVGPCDSGDIKVSTLPEDYVIAADSGYLRLLSYGLTADAVVGDFDSLGYVPENCKIIKHHVRKDDTDSMLAIKYAYELGYRVFVLLGCVGGERPDHTIANISGLVWIALHGGVGYLVGKGHAYTVIKDGSIAFTSENAGDISVFSLSESSAGVCEKGLSYTLSDAGISYGFPIGVSNSFIGEDAEISVRKGTLLIYWQTDYKTLIKTVKRRM